MKASELYIQNRKSIGELFVLNARVVSSLANLEGKIEELQNSIDSYTQANKEDLHKHISRTINICIEEFKDRKRILEILLEEVKIIHQI